MARTMTYRPMPDPVPTLWDSLTPEVEPPRFPDELKAAVATRDRKARKALDSPEVAAWKARARDAIEWLAARGLPFTVDAVLERAGLPRGAIGVNANNAVGALFLAASRAGRIRQTGRRLPTTRRTNNGRYVAEWVGVPT